MSATRLHCMSSWLRKTAIWRNLWTDNMELARHARRFIGLGLETSRRKADLVSASQRP